MQKQQPASGLRALAGLREALTTLAVLPPSRRIRAVISHQVRPADVYNAAERQESSSMSLRRTIFAMCIVPICAGAANAQFQPVRPASRNKSRRLACRNSSSFATTPKKRAIAIKAANEHKVSRRARLVRLFGALVAAQTKMLKYASENSTWCGILQASRG